MGLSVMTDIGNRRWVKSLGRQTMDDREANLSGLSMEWLSLGSCSWGGVWRGVYIGPHFTTL